MSKNVCIIGAGGSGLAATKICLEDGLNPICSELSNDIGGLWKYEEGEKDGAAFSQLHALYENHGILPDVHQRVKNNGTRLYKFMWPPNVKKSTLAIVGGVNPRGLAKLPSEQEMNEDIDKKMFKMRKGGYDLHRETTQVIHVDYIDEIAEEIGVKPNIMKLIFTDPVLVYKVLFEVASPYQYRLSGPGKWPKAREMIMTQMDRIRYPLQSRPCVARERPPKFAWTKQALCVLVFCLILYQLIWSNFKYDFNVLW